MVADASDLVFHITLGDSTGVSIRDAEAGTISESAMAALDQILSSLVRNMILTNTHKFAPPGCVEYRDFVLLDRRAPIKYNLVNTQARLHIHYHVDKGT